MATSYTSLLGLALPVQGELQGTWGDVVNQQITELVDSAVAGTTTISTDADVTLSTTTGAANQSRQAIIRWTATGTTTRNITAPAQSKAYLVINATGGTQSIVFRGVGPTTGVTIAAGKSAIVAWSGTDFIQIGGTGDVSGPVSSTDNAFARFDSTTGKLIQNSTGATLDDTGIPTFTGSVNVAGTAAASADVKLYEDTDNGTNYVSIKAPASVASNATVTVPATDGTTLGYLNVPAVGTKTSSYQLATTDVGKYVQVGTGGSITIPDSVFSEGDAINIFNNTSGSITITCSITTAYIAGTDADKATVSLATRGLATILFISSTVCVITGNVS